MTELALTDDIIPRRTGIRLLGEIPWGTHICVFYETKQDLLDTGIAYFKAGLDANEFCVWAVSPPISEQDARPEDDRDVHVFPEREPGRRHT